MHLSTTLKSFCFSAQLHWPWLAGFAVLCFAAFALMVELPALRSGNNDLDLQIKVLESQLRSMKTDEASRANPFVLLREKLSGYDRLSAVASDLHAIATKNGLVLSDVSYKPQGDAAFADIGRVEITISLKGSYLPLKKTISEMMGLHEGLALESLSVRRNLSTDTVMDMDAQLAFYYRKTT